MRLSHLLGIITAVSLSPHPSYVVLGSADFAYVSVLLSDDFLLPTRVLGKSRQPKQFCFKKP
jgi:hypothetical protein